MIMTPKEWREALAQAEKKQHPSGWSFRTDTRRLVETLEAYHDELQAIKESLSRLRL